MRDMAAQVSVANALRGAIPKFDSDPDFRSSYVSKLLIPAIVTCRALRLLAAEVAFDTAVDVTCSA